MNDLTPRLERFESYVEACREFRWVIPEKLNIATAICSRHADAVTRIALSDVKEEGINTYTFGGLDFLSDKFAMALFQSGIDYGVIAVMLPQSAALAVAHLGILKTGAAVVPLPIGIDAASLEYALVDSGASSIVIHESILGAVEPFARKIPNIKCCFVVRDLRPAVTTSYVRDFWTEVDRSSSDFDSFETDANSSAFIFYKETKGTPGGIVHSHRSVIGQLPAFEMINNPRRDADAVLWTADDWSSPRALLGLLYPAWLYGGSLVAAGFEGGASALRLMERCEVTHAFISSSQLRNISDTEPRPRQAFDLKLDTLVSVGPLSPEVCYWAKNKLGVTFNEVYCTSEAGWLGGGCERWFPPSIGSVGRAAPGHSIEIIDDSGGLLPAGQTGRLAVHKPDPSLFTEIQNAPERTAALFFADWFVTGDYGYKNEDGDLFIHHPHT